MKILTTKKYEELINTISKLNYDEGLRDGKESGYEKGYKQGLHEGLISDKKEYYWELLDCIALRMEK